MALSFDKSIDGAQKTELDARKAYVSGKDVKWNYQKYAWVSMQGTGKSTTVFCSTGGQKIGDPGLRGPHIDLYETEGGVRRFKPQLKSVKISNQGAQDYADSFIYEIEASFTCYTQAQLDAIDACYFRVGAEVEFNFGWEGYSGGANVGKVTANVYNFGFSMGDDGSFDCNIKCMSAAGLWSADDMGGIEKDDEGDADAEEDPQADFLKGLQKGFRRAFGLDDDEGPESVDDLGNNKLTYASQRDPWGLGYYYAAEIVTAPGYFNDDEVQIGYTTVEHLLNFINYQASKSPDSIYKYKLADGKLGTWPKIDAIGCADPRKFILPGNQGNYGDPNDDSWGDGDYALNFSKWGSTIAGGGTTDVGEIAVSLQFLNDKYMELSRKAGYKSGVKMNPKVVDYLKAVFAELEDLTGGLISLQLIPTDTNGNMLGPNQTVNTDTPMTLLLGNKKAVQASKVEPYVFPAIGDECITRAISLDSDFDTDMMIAATPVNITKGTSAIGGQLAGGVKTPFNANCPAPPPFGGDGPPDEAELKKIRLQYGNGGFDDSKVSSYKEGCRNYILRNCATDSKLKDGGRYGEIQFVLNLSITLDGIWGIPYLANITTDRIPSAYKQNAFFSITGVEHTFDGQGDWETSINTVMRMQ